MLSSLAIALTAFHALATPTCSQEHRSECGDFSIDSPSPPAATLVIARPEASDLFVTSKTRTTASAILVRNPELVRAKTDKAPYQLRRATALGWKTLRRSDLPGARAYNSVHATVVPEPGTAALLSLSSLLLLRRRRPPPFDARRPSPERTASRRSVISEENSHPPG